MRMDEMARADGPASPSERTEPPGQFGEAMEGEATKAGARGTEMPIASWMRWRLVGMFMGVPRGWRVAVEPRTPRSAPSSRIRS